MIGIALVSSISYAAGRAALRAPSTRAGRSRLIQSVATAPVSSVLAKEPATHPGFELVKVEMVDEYTIKCATYRHIKSGAELISAQADDDNKVFGIVFRTPVTDSTGVPHILEHSVLCGSDKYTSKEPFAELLKGSLQTFLNAFTYPDRTCYPVASQNTKDFYNLVNVYLDAVLHPRAKHDPLVLEQEGWHYELEDLKEPLTYKGVVFNEMKGVYSSPDSLLYRAAQQATFPDNTYAVDSGGDPNAITTLSFKQFTDFHDAYYHPANSRIFFYGDDDLYTRLELLDEYLRDFDAPPSAPASQVETQLLKSAPWRVVETYPVSPTEEDPTHMVMLNWLVHEEPLEQEEELALGILDHLLMGTPTSSLYKALIESGLGTAVIGGGLSDELKQATFSAGLKGVKPDDVPAVEALVQSTLAQVAIAGFDADAVEASMNTVEFSLREFNTGGFPKGLSLMLAVMPNWLYERGSPTDALRFEAPLAALKKRLAAGDSVFEDILRRRLVQNAHLATVEMKPDPEMAAREKKAEEDSLAATKAGMSEAQLQGIIDATKLLKAAQLAEDSPEQLATIPSVGLADLEREVKVVETTVDTSLGGGATLLTHALPTAGVVYADVLLDITAVPYEELPLLRVFSGMLDEVGTSEMDATALQRRIGARTGGLSTAMLFEQPVAPGGVVPDPLEIAAHLAVRGKATTEKMGDLVELMHTLLADATLDSPAKVIEMLKESKTRLEASFISSGNSYAGMRLGARTSLRGAIAESTQGVTYYRSVKELLKQATEDWPSVLARLEKLRATVLVKQGIVINLTADPAAIEASMPAIHEFLAKLPATSAHAAAPAWRDAADLLQPDVDEAYAMTTQVNYVAASTQLYAEGEKVDGAAYVVSRYLSRGYLWDNVRVVGGAYGGGCSLNPSTGVLAFSSYRDPNVQGTLDIYAATGKVLEELEISDEALEQAIVGAVGDLDSPMTSQQKGSRGLTHYLTGVTTETRQQFRDEIIATTRASFADMGEKLKGKTLKAAIFGEQEQLDKANAARADGEQIDVKPL